MPTCMRSLWHFLSSIKIFSPATALYIRSWDGQFPRETATHSLDLTPKYKTEERQPRSSTTPRLESSLKYMIYINMHSDKNKVE